jgi:hypothetical protein
MAKDSKSKSTSADLDTLINRCLHDHAFREKLEKDPAGALKDAGLHSPEREQAVRNLPYPQLQKLAQAFGEGQGLIN